MSRVGSYCEDCSKCIHNEVCISSEVSEHRCDHFKDAQNVYELPCVLGAEIWYVHHMPTRKGAGVTGPQWSLIHCTVDAIHRGRSLKNIGDTYIVLRSVNTGYLSSKVSFEEFNTLCFSSYEEAHDKLVQLEPNHYI